MQPVTITLNQRVVSGHADMSILEIARESGIDIPTLCHDPNLQSVGACRLCLVENEETGALLAACVTSVAPGMVINTNSERVVEHRKNIVKLLLASHPDACLICDKGNRCRLQQIATDLGIGFNELEKIPQSAAVEELNPFITRDTAKCVLCGKCIRSCQEIIVEGAIDYYQRGFVTRPATLNDSPLENSECTFCGLCVAMCPTGALMEKEKPYQGTTRFSVQTTCSYCGCGCPVTLEVKDKQVVRAIPGEYDQAKQGTLCIRGSYGYDYIHSKERLTKPLLKENGSFREVSWETALKAAADGLKRVKERYGSTALGVYGSSRCTNEENYLLQKFSRTVLGTNNIDNSSSFYNLVNRSGLGNATGLLSSTNLLEALEQADLILVAGADPTITAPRVGYAIKRAVKYRQAKLILVEPRRTKLAGFSYQWLRPRPGSDPALFNSMAKVIIDENLYKVEYVKPQTEGFSILSEALENYLPDAVSGVTGVPSEEINKASRLYAGANKAVIVFGSGLTCASNGTDSIKALANLAMLTENVWGSGCGIYPVQKENNAQGACEMGALPAYLPGYQPVAEAKTRQKFEQFWKKTIPSEPGLHIVEAVSRDSGKTLKALYVVGENLLTALNRSKPNAGALTRLDYMIVQDLFLTKTAELADVIFPAASFAEKEGSFTNFEGRIGWLQQAFPPVGESLPDWEIILRLAKEMGDPLPYSSLQQVVNEIEEFVPLYEGYYRPEERLGDKWSYWEERRDRALQSLTGFPRFSIPGDMPGQDAEPGEYPFYLILEANLAYFGTGTRSGKAWRLKSYYPAGVLKISISDADQLLLTSGDEVIIRSPFSQLKAAVEISDIVPPGTISIPASFMNVTELFSTGPDRERKGPPPESGYVKLERVNPDG